MQLLTDLEQLVDQAMEHFGGKIDFVLHSIGMSVNVRKGKHYTALNHDWMQKAGMFQPFFSQINANPLC